MLSCLIPRFGQEDQISMPSSTKFELQFPSLASGLPKNEENSSSQNDYFINCPQCQQEVGSFQALKDHIETFHQSSEMKLMNGQALHAELLSKLSAMSPSTSNGHLMMHHQLSPLPSMLSPDQYANNLSSGADEGGRQSTSPNNLNRFSVTNRAHACSQPQCSASFPTLDLLEKHEVVHATNATNSCRLCHKSFANVYRLQRHMISHDESALLRKFKCTDCDKAFKFKHHLKEHLRIHSGEKPFGCHNCGKRFSHSGSYSSHMTSKKCVSMGLKMNNNNLNGTTNNNSNSFNGLKFKQEKKQLQQHHQQMTANFLNQSPLGMSASTSKFLPNQNPFLPMMPKYESNFDVMNAALLATFHPFFPMGLNNTNALNPYHIQNLLKLTAAQAQHDAPTDNTEKLSDNQKSSNLHSDPEDMIEEVNEYHNDDPKLVMDINDEGVKKEFNIKREQKTTDQHHNESDADDDDNDEPMSDCQTKIESNHIELDNDNSHSPSIKQELPINMELDTLRCQHCDKLFNHPAELVQHEKVLCSSLLFKKHEGLMAQMVESMSANNSYHNNSTINVGSEDDNDDRESKISTESERKVRVRTAISDDQQTVLKEYYTVNARPNREEFRNIAQRLMLDARVVQVWFQNNRSRERKQSGVRNPMLAQVNGSQDAIHIISEDQPLDLSVRKERDSFNDTPSSSPRYGTVPLQQPSEMEAMNLSRKMSALSPDFRPGFNYNSIQTDFLARQIPSPNEAVPSHQNIRNGYGLHGPLGGMPFEHLLQQYTPEMARHPLLMLKTEQRGNSLSPGSSEKRSWKDDESRSYDEMHHHHLQPQHHTTQRRMPKMKSEIPPDSDEYNFVCDLCDKAFRKQSSLARHKYEHSGQRPYKCIECPKAFKHKHHLTEHKRLHSGEKPFQCSKCLKRFSHSGSYSQHMNHRYSYCKPYRD
ncbi:unnamed protein product [Diamesa serratosioi]